MIVEANAKEISYLEISDEISISEDQELLEQETECTVEVPEVSAEEDELTDELSVMEVEETETSVEVVSEKSELEVKIIIEDIGNYVDFVNYEAIIFVLDELFFQVWEMDADAKAFVVQYGEEYYFIVEWDVHDGNGFVKLNCEVNEDEEFFFCDGDEFRTMIIRSYVAAEEMFEA